ncbi:MAG TPA: hypothetical protein VD887_03975 [Allosphingosinicella sp.]|nr:hypothetical protein [Allosphingosinicella sp.]
MRKKATMPLWPAWLLLAGAAACAVPAITTSRPAEPRYVASGHEPGWYLVIDRGRMDYMGDYREIRITVPQPEPRTIANGRRFRTPRLAVDIVRARCNELLTGLGYEDRVTVVADGLRFKGCGGARRIDWDVQN